MKWNVALERAEDKRDCVSVMLYATDYKSAVEQACAVAGVTLDEWDVMWIQSLRHRAVGDVCHNADCFNPRGGRLCDLGCHDSTCVTHTAVWRTINVTGRRELGECGPATNLWRFADERS